ncbi:MAG TPA: cysteine desulfurase family protein [Kiritimatiellia bacterium]|nr:cysteine desulfurase family protein [Kiritimatiellia bacterium]
MIYADHNATSPLDPLVWDAMRPFFTERFHNPASPYTPARAAALAITSARERVAELVDCAPEEIIFTSGGTESNTTAIHLARAWNPDRRHWICSAVEHASVLEPLAALEREGHRVSHIPVDRSGRIDLAALDAALTEDTALVCVMSANNETGIVHPIDEIAARAHARGVPVHVDAVQSVGRVPLSVRALGVDLLTCCAHKMHGPKGAGALVVRAGRSVGPLIRGGGQEQGRRAGTENVPALVGFGAAAARARMLLEAEGPRVRALRDQVEADIRGALPDVVVVGADVARLPNTTLFLVPGLHTDVLLARLDLADICCSSGSACASGSAEPSHVLKAMGWGGDSAPAALRVSWGRFSTEAEANILVSALVNGVSEVLRAKHGSACSKKF